jgi:tetratricopeptide (TPR) repeat protein
MARGAAQAQKRAKEKPQQKKRKQRAAPSWEQQMFFPRLRRQAKWVFVFLALVFAVGFVAFGVGSGSTGIGDILRGNFFGSNGSSNGSRIKADQKTIKNHPKDTSAYLDLAAIYQQENKQAQAIATLERAARIAPKNIDVLNSLANIYSGRAQEALTAYNSAQTAISSNYIAPPYADAGDFGQAFAQDPYSQSLSTSLNDAQSKAVTSLKTAETAYQRAATAAKGTSNEAGAQLQIANIAVQAVQLLGQGSDTRLAIAAYERYLKLDPNGVQAAQAKQTLARLKAFLPQAQG